MTQDRASDSPVRIPSVGASADGRPPAPRPLVIHGAGPWRTSNHGRYLAGLAAALAPHGWDIAWSAFGVSAPMTLGNARVVPAGAGEPDILRRNARLLDPETSRPAVFCLADPAALVETDLDDVNVALYCELTHLTPTTSQLNTVQRLDGRPVTMSAARRDQFEREGIAAEHIPLSTLGTALSAVSIERREPMRRRLGVDADEAVVGVRAANLDWRPGRSRIAELLTAARLLIEETRATTVFLDIWTRPDAPAPIDVNELVADLGFPPGTVRPIDDSDRRLGLDTAGRGTWFAPCDVVLVDPGLELPALDTLDAQACGVPVVVVDSPGCDADFVWGTAVTGDPRWDAAARQWAPAAAAGDLASAAAELLDSDDRDPRAAHARAFAAGRDHTTVVANHWAAAFAGRFGAPR